MKSDVSTSHLAGGLVADDPFILDPFILDASRHWGYSGTTNPANDWEHRKAEHPYGPSIRRQYQIGGRA